MDSSDDFRKVLEKAFRLLGSRTSSRAILARKLKDRGFEGKLIAQALDECERLNVLNDKAFAEDYIQSLHARGYGLRRIKNTLAQKGIKKELIDELLLSDTPDEKNEERERAKKVFDAKLRLLHKEDDLRKRRDKLFRYMASRGFSADIIYELLRPLK
ncbi:MAG: hypothetical protein A2020_09685 [Lentisphaerae bacterium GWF2_45_14]|nr:MAG: hypothetical protein A2020_09685 [Lentisphaerae bacterium GWF2_45_14]